MKPFVITEDTIHHVGDHACPECEEEYPEPCACGGLMHAEAGTEPDPEGNYPAITRCDFCGRSEDQLDEV